MRAGDDLRERPQQVSGRKILRSGGGGGTAPGGYDVRWAESSGGITAASGYTPGAGNVTLLDYDAGSGDLVPEASATAVLNGYQSAIADGRRLLVVWISSRWWVATEDCF